MVEQAKGIVSQRLGVDMVEAFRLLRSHARSNHVKLRSVAEGPIEETISPERLG